VAVGLSLAKRWRRHICGKHVPFLIGFRKTGLSGAPSRGHALRYAAFAVAHSSFMVEGMEPSERVRKCQRTNKDDISFDVVEVECVHRTKHSQLPQIAIASARSDSHSKRSLG
jgi:hypothetical protein